MDLLYVLGSDSKWCDNELRYSLRSAERFQPHERVVISGRLPSWVQHVTHVPAGDQWSMPVRNTLHKLHVACASGAVAERFTLWNDDFFLLAPFDAEAPTLVAGTLEQRVIEGPRGADPHYDVIQEGLIRLRKHGIHQPLNYEMHVPMVMERGNVLEMIRLFGPPDARNVYPWRSVYGNLFRVPALLAEDVKQRHRFVPPPEGERFLSTGDDSVLSPEFHPWCETQWPSPSRYERS